MKSLIFCLILTTVACANNHYYYGAVKYYSQDGKQSYGETVSLVKRSYDKDNDKIIELVTQPSQSSIEKVEEYTTDIIRDIDNTFHASDSGNTFNGTIKFFGEDWKWEAWDYDITLADGGKITGVGFLTTAGIYTSKNFVGPQMQMKIIETLKPISEKEYRELHSQMFRE